MSPLAAAFEASLAFEAVSLAAALVSLALAAVSLADDFVSPAFCTAVSAFDGAGAAAGA